MYYAMFGSNGNTLVQRATHRRKQPATPIFPASTHPDTTVFGALCTAETTREISSNRFAAATQQGYAVVRVASTRIRRIG